MRALRGARHALALLLLAALGPQATAARRTPALRPATGTGGANQGQVVLLEPAGGGGARGGGAAWTFPANAAAAPAPAASAQPDLSQLVAQFTAEQAAAAAGATAPPAAPSVSGGAASPLGVKPSGRPLDDAGLLEMLFAAAPGPLPGPAPAPATRPVATPAAVQPAALAVAQGPAPLVRGGARARSGGAAPALLRLKALEARGDMEGGGGGVAQRTRAVAPLPTAAPPAPVTRPAPLAPAPGPVAALEVEELVDTVLLAGLAAAELAAEAPLPSAAPPAAVTAAAPAPAPLRVLAPRQMRKRMP